MSTTSTYTREMYVITEVIDKCINKWLTASSLWKQITRALEYHGTKWFKPQSNRGGWQSSLVWFWYYINTRALNGLADTLSWILEVSMHASSVYKPVAAIWVVLCHSYKDHPKVLKLYKAINYQPFDHPFFIVLDGLLLYKGASTCHQIPLSNNSFPPNSIAP